MGILVCTSSGEQFIKQEVMMIENESDLFQVTYVIVDGPYSGGISADIGDEIPEWVVALCDDDGADLQTHTCASY